MKRNYYYSKSVCANTKSKAAYYFEMPDGAKILISYETPVLYVKGDCIKRLWGNWSATTMNHINVFMARVLGRCGWSKKEWLELPCGIISLAKYPQNVRDDFWASIPRVNWKYTQYGGANFAGHIKEG